FSWRWLRDHGEDPASLDTHTLQRRVDTFSIADDISATAVTLMDGGAALTISWNDGSPETTCSAELLRSVVACPPDPPQILWAEGGRAAEPTVFRFDEVLSDEAILAAWLDEVRCRGFGVVGGVPATKEGATGLAERLTQPRSTVFGSMWRLSSEMVDHQDSAYSTTFLEPHTDSTYMTDAPGTQLFCCLERTGTGGESILVDGFAIAAALRADAPEAFEVLSSLDVPARYIEPGVHLRAERPPIRLDASGQVVQLSFNNYDRAPFWLPEPKMSEFYDAYSLLHDHIIDRERWHQLRLDPGDALIFDNWRVLHGRQAYTGRRVFYGCYHNRDDVLSRLRALTG
ncbi:MAG: TauD/TfdA family dioxygenase, partial [Acidimicrobiales bacterium]